jgi:hypothetical protein
MGARPDAASVTRRVEPLLRAGAFADMKLKMMNLPPPSNQKGACQLVLAWLCVEITW